MAREDRSQNPNKPYWMLTLGLGMALTRAALDWGESALEELSAMETEAAQNTQPSEGKPVANEA
jgi:hypothetical protein